MSPLNQETTCPKSRSEWREWLIAHHAKQGSIWIVYHKKDSGIPRVSWKDAVEEALCFGWIDGRAQPLDELRYRQFFCRRKPGGTWSKINKDSVQRLRQQGLMTPAGEAAVARAMADGSWNILDEVEALLVPDDLVAALTGTAGAAAYFDALSRSSKRAILQWLVMAKRPETRQKRIGEIALQAAAGKRPKGF